MKFHINKALRTGFIVIVILIEVLITILLYNKINNPGFQEHTVPKYNYTNTATADYKVYLKPNDLYQKRIQESGESYILGFIDHLTTKFEYKFEGSDIADLNGNYDIVAKVSGTVRKGVGEADTVIWEKNFPLKGKQDFSVNDRTLSIDEELSIKLDDFNEFARLANETSKISFITSLQISMNININGTTGDGIIEDVISSSLVIPLNTPMFEIITNNIEKPGAVEETIQVQIPIDKTQVIIFGVIIVVLAIGLIFLIFITKSTPKRDKLDRELNKIFKKHGDRLVALSSDVDISNARNVKSIDDLVKLADEINKPIFYKYSVDYKEINKFFITNDFEIYVLDLEYLKQKEEVASEQLNEVLTTNIE